MIISDNFYQSAIKLLEQKGHSAAVNHQWVFTPESQHLLMLTNRQYIIEWAKNLLASEKTLFIDTETTGLPQKYPNAEIVELTIVRYNGQVQFSSLLKPKYPIPVEASEVNGIWQKDLEEAFPITAFWGQLSNILNDKNVVAYNADFDHASLRNTARIHGLVPPADYVKPTFECAMKAYSVYRNSFNWWKLTQAIDDEQKKMDVGTAHTAIADTLALFTLIDTLTRQDAENFILPPMPESPSAKIIDALNKRIEDKGTVCFDYVKSEELCHITHWEVVVTGCFQNQEGQFYISGMTEDGTECVFRYDKIRFKKKQ